ncbi:MAG: hypothetical protein K2X00_09695 [Nitrospiraceae bacterium]|nr:hypothetical protein [Nitrospiraceae bacterium]
MSNSPPLTPDEVTVNKLPMTEFLEATPPSTLVEIQKVRVYRTPAWYVFTPEIQLHCGSESCGGTRFFSHRSGSISFDGTGLNTFLVYVCRNCNSSSKIFAVELSGPPNREAGKALKIGEWPVFGPPTPSRLVSLVGPDRDAFLKGRRAENQGLGIGSFAYYRRVVENQKNRLLDEIIRVAERTRSAESTLTALATAKNETQFSKAVEIVKDCIPPSLLIDGHNPLVLLHDALSDGLHAQTDEECLEIATSVRVILQEMSEKTAAALKDHAELKSALSRLLNRHDKKSDRQSGKQNDT